MQLPSAALSAMLLKCPARTADPPVYATKPLIAVSDYPGPRLQFPARRLEPQNVPSRSLSTHGWWQSTYTTGRTCEPCEVLTGDLEDQRAITYADI